MAGSVLNSSSKPGNANCNTACDGNSKQTCGGLKAISLYNNTQCIKPFNPNPVSIPNSANKFASVGCYNEGTYSRALTGSSSTSTPMSVRSILQHEIRHVDGSGEPQSVFLRHAGTHERPRVESQRLRCL
jgi:hypothetical protein